MEKDSCAKLLHNTNASNTSVVPCVSTIHTVSTPSFNKLEGRSNYTTWAFSMEMMLIDCGLWDCVKHPPLENSSQELLRCDDRARSKIGLCCHERVFSKIMGAKSAFEAWNNLKRTYADSGLIRKLTLMKRLMNCRYIDNMEIYVNEIMSTHQQLQQINQKVDDSFLAIILLCGLPEQFKPLVMALEHSGSELTSDNVIAALLKEDSRDLATCSDTREDSALVMSYNKFNRDTKNIFCNYCRKPGHVKANCRILKAKSQGEKADICEVTLMVDDQPVSNSNFDNSEACESFVNSFVCKPIFNKSPFVKSDDWFIDSGATSHMTNRRDWLHDTEPVKKSIRIANDQIILSDAIGTVKLNTSNITEVLHVPNLSTNLLSVNSLVKKGNVVLFSKSGGKIIDGQTCKVHGKVLYTASNVNGMYKLDLPIAQANLTEVNDNSADLWHKRLGHLNFRCMELLRLHLAHGVKYPKPAGSIKDNCIACVEGKLSKQPFKMSDSKSSNLLEIIHSDVCGPMSTQSLGGALYFVTFTDDFSRKTFTYIMKQKSEVVEKFREFKNLVENQTDKKIKILRSDNGGEYLNAEMKEILKQSGIVHQTTVPYNPEQNGLAERVNRTLVEKARSMLSESCLPKTFWGEAVYTATYLKNRSPTKAIRGKTPEEIWTGRKVNLSHLRIFGCKVYAHIPKNLRKKFDAKAKLCIFVGYCTETKGYRVVDPEHSKILIRTRDAKFFENDFPFKSKSTYQNNIVDKVGTQLSESIPIVIQENSENIPTEGEANKIMTEPLTQLPHNQLNVPENDNTEEEFHDSLAEIPDDTNNQVAQPVRRYPLRNRIPKKWSEDIVLYKAVEDNIPSNYKEAIYSDDTNKWQEALKSEYDSLVNNETWILVDRPKDRKIVRCKWVFKIKQNENGENVRYKARLVAKGFTQTYGIDYDETFAPVARLSTVRLLLAFAAQWNIKMDQMDVETAFLNGDLNEEIFMEQPEGFTKECNKGKVCQLKKALYGLKQAPRQWNLKLNEAMMQLGMKRSEHDHCLYYKVRGPCILIVAIFVDDFCILSNSADMKENFKNNIQQFFKVKDLGNLKYFLGMRIIQEENGITIDQEEYIKKVLDNFAMTDAKPASTPADPNLKLVNPSNEEKEAAQHLPYQRLVGSLMYLSVGTRPDITHAVSVLSQFNSNFGTIHWDAAKRVLRYLKGTINLKLKFQKKNTVALTGYTDADYGACLNDRRSYTGYVFYLNGPVSWESRKQRTVALSTTEAEYMALSDAAKESIYLKNLLKEVFGLDNGVCIHSDNQGAQMLTKNNIHHSRTKHIDVRHHFIRDTVANGIISIEYVPTNEMKADVLTKFLSKQRHLCLTKGLGLV